MEDNSTLNPVELATELTVAWLGNPNNRIAADEAPVFLRQMHATILELSGGAPADAHARSEEHTSELQSLMRISYAVFCLKKKKATTIIIHSYNTNILIKSDKTTRKNLNDASRIQDI